MNSIIAALQCPVKPADAMVVLCGEDAEARAEIVPQLLVRQYARTVLLMGGKDGPPRWHSAERINDLLVGKGVNPSAILLETSSQNTREQAVNFVEIAKREDWHRVLLVASCYHSGRAWLTFLQALKDAGQERLIHIQLVPAFMSWGGKVPGMDEARYELLRPEALKIDEYRAKGHVADEDTASAYVQHWERVA